MNREERRRVNRRSNRVAAIEDESRPKSRQKRKNSWARLGIVALVIVTLGLIIAQQKLRTVRVEGTNYKGELTAVVESSLKNQLFGSNVLLLRANGVERDIYNSLGDRVAQVRVKKDLLKRSLSITANDRQPALMWQSQGKLYIVDQTGRITKQAQKRANLPLIIDETNVAVGPQSKVVSSQFRQFINKVEQHLLAAAGTQPKQYRVRTTTNEVLVDTAAGYYVLFDTTGSAGEQLDSLRRVIQNAKTKNHTIAHHIDVRLAYKAYYQ